MNGPSCGKGSALYSMFGDFWELNKKYYNGDGTRITDRTMSLFIKDKEKFVQRYGTRYSSDMADALHRELLNRKSRGTLDKDPFLKNSPLRNMYTQFWVFNRELMDGDTNHQRTEKYFEELVDAASELHRRYRTEYTKELVLACIFEIDRRSKTA